MSTVISVENVSKLYRLGLISSGTLSRDLERWWARVRGKPDPLLKIGEQDHDNRDGEFIWALGWVPASTPPSSCPPACRGKAGQENIYLREQ